MKISDNLVKIIFWLSTIVAVTDCCYSQILPRLNQTMVVVVEQKSEEFKGNDAAFTTDVDVGEESTQQHHRNQEDTILFQGEIEKYLQHIKDFINSIAINPNKTKTEDTLDVADEDEKHNITVSTMVAFKTKNILKSLPANINNTIVKAYSSVALDKPLLNVNSNSNYNFLELYTLMSDTLSASCTGEYASHYCLNNGQCFVHMVGLFYCKCAEGYVGERCESKYIYALTGEYRPSSKMEKKSKVLSARVVAPFRAVIFLTIIYLSISLLWSYKCQPHQISIHSSRHLIY